MGGEVLDGGGHPQEVVAVEAVGGAHRRELRQPLGEGARLVEGGGAHPGELLERAASLDDDAVPGRPGHAGHERHRGSDEQWAWCGDDEDLGEARGVAAGPPCGAGHGEGQEREGDGDPVGEPDERGPRLLGRPDEVDDPLVLRVRGRGRGADADRPRAVDRPGQELLAAQVLDGQRLAGEGRLVERARRREEHRVNGQDLARLDEQLVAGPDGADGHLGASVDARVGGEQVGGPRRTLEQGGELPFGASRREGVEGLARREHQHHDQRGPVLADGDRGRDRRDGEDVDAVPAPAQRRDHVPAAPCREGQHVDRQGPASGHRLPAPDEHAAQRADEQGEPDQWVCAQRADHRGHVGLPSSHAGAHVGVWTVTSGPGSATRVRHRPAPDPGNRHPQTPSPEHPQSTIDTPGGNRDL